MLSEKLKIFFAYLKILRISNFIISFFSVYLVIILSDNDYFYKVESIFTAIAAALIGAAGMIINDYFDYEIDLINQPNRPIPSGLISKKNGLVYYLLINIISLILLIYTNYITFLIAFLSIFIIFLYSYRLKRVLFWGNITVAFMTSLAFVFGSSLTGKYEISLNLALLAFLINFAREILKDIQDFEGDKKYNVRSIPVIYGKNSSLIITKSILVIVILLTFVIFLYSDYKIEFLLVLVFGVNLPLLYIVKELSNNYEMIKIKRLQTLIKYLMPVGLIAFYLA